MQFTTKPYTVQQRHLHKKDTQYNKAIYNKAIYYKAIYSPEGNPKEGPCFCFC